MKNLVSVIIPIYNEEEVIKDCLESLSEQTCKPLEIILVDDGSTDKTKEIIGKYSSSEEHSDESRSLIDSSRQARTLNNIIILNQNHLGPGPARNMGASKARGDILVFVDADMTFDKDFVKDLIRPIIDGKSIGTFSKNEMVKNAGDIWSVCWNINRNLPPDRMLSANYPNAAPVFRAILKSEFDKVNGFDTTGEYTDDWSLGRKLGTKSTLAGKATYYHSNPSSLPEIYKQARWIGKNEFISGSFPRKTRSLIQYSLPASIIIGLFKSLLTFNPQFSIFKIVYDWGVWTSVIKSFFGESKAK